MPSGPNQDQSPVALVTVHTHGIYHMQVIIFESLNRPYLMHRPCTDPFHRGELHPLELFKHGWIQDNGNRGPVTPSLAVLCMCSEGNSLCMCYITKDHMVAVSHCNLVC